MRATSEKMTHVVDIGATLARSFAAHLQLHARARAMLHIHDQLDYNFHPSIRKPQAHASCVCINAL